MEKVNLQNVLALSTEGRKAYVATGQAFDEEMVDRIKKTPRTTWCNMTNFEVPLYWLKSGKILANLLM